MFLNFIIIGWSVSFVVSGVSIQPYCLVKAPRALCPSDSLDIRSETPPIAIALVTVPSPNILADAAPNKGTPAAANPFADNTIPAAMLPKCTVPLKSLPHHVLVMIGSSSSTNGSQSGL